MNISKQEKRVLHVLAQGGQIRYLRGPNGRILQANCFTHDGMILSDCTLQIMAKLRRKKLIASTNSSPYRIMEKGRRSVLSQLNNRV